MDIAIKNGLPLLPLVLKEFVVAAYVYLRTELVYPAQKDTKIDVGSYTQVDGGAR